MQLFLHKFELFRTNMICIQVCASSEWEAVIQLVLKDPKDFVIQFPLEYFDSRIGSVTCRFFKGGSTKTRSAASCQYAIDHWHPLAIIVIGTCGGVRDNLKSLDIILANRTGQYDVIDRIGKKRPLFYECFNVIIDNRLLEPEKHQDLFTEGFIATADQDMVFEQMKMLQPYNVAGADWESGAISAICKINKINCHVFRGVSDIPSPSSKQEDEFKKNTPKVIRKIIEILLPVVIPLISSDTKLTCNLK